MSSKVILSLDVGTTSVKAVVIKNIGDNYEVLSSYSLKTDADQRQENNKFFSEQLVDKIIKACNVCVSKVLQSLTQELVKSIEAITLCGQMHGCMLWNEATNFDGDYQSTNLYTWQDARCSLEFLKSLPLSSSCSLPLSSGFGIATMLWILKNEPETLAMYSCSGTIMDYIVFNLCGLHKPVISTHNATSWGYFDMVDETWDLETLKATGFPVHILPRVVSPGSVVGTLSMNWHGLMKSTKVYVPLGDLQCSVLSCLPKCEEAVINLSTSAQISKVCEKPRKIAKNEKDPYLPPPVIVLPFFGNKYVKTSASLNGGAVFASYVDMLLKWTRKFSPDTTVDEIYREILKDDTHGQLLTTDEDASPLRIEASVNGERHDPNIRGSVVNISQSDLDFSLMGRHLARAILSNLKSMFGDELSHIWACGGAFAQNPLFRQQVSCVFSGKTVSFERDCDAAFGAAISICQGEKCFA